MLVLLHVLILTGLSSSLECGVFKDKSRIVGGMSAGHYKYPWFASLHPIGNRNSQICAGSLITSRIVLTAGHCFNAEKEIPFEDLYEVTLGIFDHCKDEPNSETFRTTQVIVHEKFTDPTGFFDIAIMTLDGEANFIPICLPPKGDDILHVDKATIMGFGTTEFGTFKKPCEMYEATVKIFTSNECQNSSIPKIVIQKMVEFNYAFCAGLMEGGVDTCQGDSGGPILTRRDKRYVQEGIVSFGYSCGERDLPGVYTHVSSYIDWLNKNIPGGLPKSIITPNTGVKPVKPVKPVKKRKRKPGGIFHSIGNIIDNVFGH